ncbi:hypothetical protein BG011_003220 [Mortierella polycephala]|uniref:Uncharacterized protein n=1 Tax=Mortierella polycephala TaxID=41804 RepID=A0A9P6U473_9FUNG|nr:hypothetical protein BG011_003220 [Mortierella polycephala]
MMPIIRNAAAKATTHRFISNSARSYNAVALGHHASPSMANAATSATSRTAKTVAYALLGSTAVIGGFSILLKDEVVYWTPNSNRK